MCGLRLKDSFLRFLKPWSRTWMTFSAGQKNGSNSSGSYLQTPGMTKLVITALPWRELWICVWGHEVWSESNSDSRNAGKGFRCILLANRPTDCTKRLADFKIKKKKFSRLPICSWVKKANWIIYSGVSTDGKLIR